MGQYIGARYVPRFMGEYDVTQSYEALDVVDNGSGTSYISKKPVPAGTPLTNTTYWFVYGAASGAIINLQNQIDAINEDLTKVTTRVDTILTPELFGAVGDGVTDDTTALQDMFDYALSLNNDAPYGIKCAVLLNGKEYRTTNTIRHDNSVKVILLGNTYIKSEVTNKAAWLIDSSLGHVSETDPYAIQELYKKGEVFEGGGNLCIVATNPFSNNIGLQVGTDTSEEIAICNISGLSIIDFSVGLFVNSVNTYIITFTRLYLEYNAINVKYGGDTFYNSNEKITFRDCTFGHAYRCVYLAQLISTMTFENCSFDFNNSLFVVDYSGNGLVALNHCHIEGTGSHGGSVPHLVSNDNGYYYYVLGSRPYNCYKFNITNSYILDTHPQNSAEYRIGAENNTKIVSYLIGNAYSLSKNRYKDIKAIADDHVYLSETYESETDDVLLLGTLRDSVGKMDTIPTLSNQDIQADQTLVSPYYVIGNTWSGWVYKATSLTNPNDVIFSKSLLVNIPHDYSSSGLRREYTCKGKWVKVRIYVKSRNLNKATGNYYRAWVSMYDSANKKLREYSYDETWTDDDWTTYNLAVPVADADHIVVIITLKNDDGVSGDFILGGCIIEDCM